MPNLGYISIEDFKKLDIRIGKIVEVIDHPKADRLYVLRVDLGDHTRTLIAGIKPWYKKEELIGKNIVVLTNLEPKNIRGVKSEGMILAAEDNELCQYLRLIDQ